MSNTGYLYRNNLRAVLNIRFQVLPHNISIRVKCTNIEYIQVYKHTHIHVYVCIHTDVKPEEF